MNIRHLLKFVGGQDLLRFGVRDRVIRYFHDPDRCDSEEFTVPFFGALYRGNFNTFIDWSVFYYGAYSREELRLIADVLESLESPAVFDIGANVGHHTLFAALCAGQVYAFEPLSDVYERLERKVEDNRLANVKLCRFGLGEKSTLAAYVLPKGHNTGTGSFAHADRAPDAISLAIKQGDEFVHEEGIERIDFIKIDTEGYEPQVLRGLSQTLGVHRPVVFFEWTQNERNDDELARSDLFPVAYRFFEFVPDTVVLGVFRQPGYRLRVLRGSWPDGNILAVPNEYMERVGSQYPVSPIARRLRQDAGE